MGEGSLIVPSHAAKARRAQLAATEQQNKKGLRRAIHDRDPRLEIFERVGMSGPEDTLVDPESGKPFRLHGNRVLVAIYQRPEAMTTSTGAINPNTGQAFAIHLPDGTRGEDEHQGKSALVLMKGWSAFKSDPGFDFGPDNVDVGEWISLWVTEGRKIVINGQICRIVRDQDINMVIPAPDVVY